MHRLFAVWSESRNRHLHGTTLDDLHDNETIAEQEAAEANKRATASGEIADWEVTLVGG